MNTYLASGAGTGGLMGLRLPPTPSSPMPPQAQPQQQAPQAPQAQPDQRGDATYNGTVTYKGEKIEIKNGVFESDGHKFSVSADGKVVADEQRRFAGTIQNGELKLATKDMIDQFTKEGILVSPKQGGAK